MSCMVMDQSEKEKQTLVQGELSKYNHQYDDITFMKNTSSEMKVCGCNGTL